MCGVCMGGYVWMCVTSVLACICVLFIIGGTLSLWGFNEKFSFVKVKRLSCRLQISSNLLLVATDKCTVNT